MESATGATCQVMMPKWQQPIQQITTRSKSEKHMMHAIIYVCTLVSMNKMILVVHKIAGQELLDEYGERYWSNLSLFSGLRDLVL
jgi:hypothetical protein